MFFKDILGLSDIKKQLTGAVASNHLAHALLFSGIEGGAGLSMALAFAAYVNCENRSGEDACGVCPSCQKNRKFIHPDVHFVFPVCSTKDIKGSDVVSASYLKEWRSFLLKNPYGTVADWSVYFGGDNRQLNISKEESRHIIRNLSLKAFEGRYKIMLVWLPEYMHPTAANAILKILEEPPAQTLFLLVSQSAGDLLPTIISRTQLFNVSPFTEQELKDALVEQFDADETRAEHAAQLAGGSMNYAVKLLEEVEEDSHKLFREWMRVCFSYDLTQMISMMETFQKMNKLGQKTMLMYGMTIMRETLLEHAGGQSLSKIHGDEREFVEKFGKVIDPDMIATITSRLNDALYHLERNANVKIVFLDLSLNIGSVMRRQ